VPAKTLLYAVVALEPSHRICVIEDAVFIVPRGEYKEGERVRVMDGPYERFFGSFEAASAAAHGAARGARVLEFQVSAGTAVMMTLCTDVRAPPQAVETLQLALARSPADVTAVPPAGYSGWQLPSGELVLNNCTSALRLVDDDKRVGVAQVRRLARRAGK
jgi:hypothetical protein